jgi:hypothetical protein
MDSKDRGYFGQNGQAAGSSAPLRGQARRMLPVCAVETDAFRSVFVQKLGQNYTPL